MAKPCTAYLIDPFTQTIEAVEWNGDYNHIYKLIGADMYDCARINKHGDGIFVDDEGLYVDEQKFFLFADYHMPLAGKGLVLGCDAEGESVAPHITLEELRAKTTWVLPVRVNGGQVVWLDVGGQVTT